MQNLSIEDINEDDDKELRCAFVRTLKSYLTALDKKKILCSDDLNIVKIHQMVADSISTAQKTSPKVLLYLELLRVINNNLYLFSDPIIPLKEFNEA